MKKIRVNVGGRDFLYWDGFYWLTGDAEFDGKPFENSSIDIEFAKAEKAFRRLVSACKTIDGPFFKAFSELEKKYVYDVLAVADSYVIEVLVCS